MTGGDRINRLEALGRLRADGTLDEEEFAREKRRVLEEDAGNQPGAGTSWRLPVAAVAVAAAVAGGAWILGSLATPDGRGDGPAAVRRPVPANVIAVRDAPARPAATTPTPSPTTSPAVLDGALTFASPAKCIAGETLQRVYGKLDRAMDKSAALTIKIDAFPRPLTISATSAKDAEGGWSATAEVRMPEGTTWHGLRIARVTSAWNRPPETDSVYGRSITFTDPPERVARTLNRLGFRIVDEPGFSELPDTYNSCGGAMSVEARPGGSALSCSWGC